MSDLGLRRWFSDFFGAGGLLLSGGGGDGGDLGGRRAGDDDDQDAEKQGQGGVDDDGHDNGGGFFLAVVGIGYGGKLDGFVWQHGDMGEVVERYGRSDGFLFVRNNGGYRDCGCWGAESDGDDGFNLVEF